MLVKTRIIDVETRVHKMKEVADVTLKFSDPNEVTICTLWNNSVSKGEHKVFAEMAGKEVYIAIRPDVFNGKLQYQINTQVLPQLVQAAPSK